jgi:hypothetical protein
MAPTGLRAAVVTKAECFQTMTEYKRGRQPRRPLRLSNEGYWQVSNLGDIGFQFEVITDIQRAAICSIPTALRAAT